MIRIGNCEIEKKQREHKVGFLSLKSCSRGCTSLTGTYAALPYSCRAHFNSPCPDNISLSSKVKFFPSYNLNSLFCSHLHVNQQAMMPATNIQHSENCCSQKEANGSPKCSNLQLHDFPFT